VHQGLHLANIHEMHNQYNAMKAVYRIECVTTKFHDDKNLEKMMNHLEGKEAQQRLMYDFQSLCPILV
jgi:hypothetical protein